MPTMNRNTMLFAATLFIVVSASAYDTTTNVQSLLHANKDDSSKAVAEVKLQIEILRGNPNVSAVKRIRLVDGTLGWHINYRQTDQTLSRARTSMSG